MEQEKNYKLKVSHVLKRYGYYMLLGIGILAFIFIIIYSGTSKPKVAEVNATITYSMPVLNATVYKEYRDNNLMYNSTLNQWEAHKCVDFLVTSGSNVYAIFDGVVKDIYTNYLEGTVIVVEHNNSLTSKYGSLEENVNVQIGNVVTKGQVIGKASDSAKREVGIGSYLRFELLQNGNKVDPAGYLNITAGK